MKPLARRAIEVIPRKHVPYARIERISVHSNYLECSRSSPDNATLKVKLDSNSGQQSMRWTPPQIVSGIQTLYSAFARTAVLDDNHVLEDIRQVMLDELAMQPCPYKKLLQLKITESRDLQDLWYLRGDLMAAIAEVEGESSARRKMNQISNLFRGTLPKGMSSRPSPLSD